MRIVIAVAVVVMSSLALIPRVAEACSCIDPMQSTSLVAPADGATDVPVNARIWVGSGQMPPLTDEQTGQPKEPAVQLLDDQDQFVVGTQSIIQSTDGLVYVFTPAQPLGAGRTYRARANGAGIAAFTTGSGTDTEAPAVPSVVSEDSDAAPNREGPACGPSYWVRYELKTDGILTVADRDGTSTLNPEALSGTVTSLEQGTAFQLGRNACVDNWPGVKSGDTGQVRFGTFDLAGNFSGFSQPREATIPYGCGCSAGAAPGSALVLGLAMLARRRKR
jgi:MYXO-CTERM domain-containing protein